MGIKFRCPNGHKLNVKSFLAGKRGVCPKCGTSLRIPLESTRGQDVDSPGDEGEGDDLLDEARFPAPGRAAAMAAATRESAPAAVAASVAIAAPAAIPVSASADPIAEAPTAVWYVRPPSGDQYGPARGDVMRRWIGEGRVSADSLVWREGWADWLAAGEVFPSIKSPAAQPPTPPSVPAVKPKSDPVAEAPAEASMPARSTRLTNRYEARRKQGSGMGIAVIVFLGLLCVVLAALLVYVFVFAGSGGTPKPKSQLLPAHATRLGRRA